MEMSPLENTNLPHWLAGWADDIRETTVLDSAHRKNIVDELTGRPAIQVSSSEYPHQLRDGGDVAWLTAIVEGEESSPGAMISRSDGRIVKVVQGVSARRVDTILREMEEATARVR